MADNPPTIQFPFYVEVTSRDLPAILDCQRDWALAIPAVHEREPRTGPILTCQVIPRLDINADALDALLRPVHDSRVAAIELLTSVSLLNRIAYLISSLDKFLSEHDPRQAQSPFHFDQECGFPRLLPGLASTILTLRPEAKPRDMTPERAQQLSEALRVSFVVEEITLNSPLSFKAKLFAVFLTLGTLAPAAKMLVDVAGAGAQTVRVLTKADQVNECHARYTELFAQDLKSNVRLLQQLLLQQGIDPGPIDGRLGPRTSEAVRQFAVRRNLPPDITLSSEVFRHALASQAAQKVQCL
jgi:Putative peptidoglycan binding domain